MDTGSKWSKTAKEVGGADMSQADLIISNFVNEESEEVLTGGSRFDKAGSDRRINNTVYGTE